MTRRLSVPERVRGLVLLRKLIEGEKHDRLSAAALLGVEPSTAYLWMKALEETIPGVEWAGGAQRGRALLYRRRDPDAPHAVVALAACVAGSLAPLFGDSAWRDNIRGARDYLVKRVEGKHRFENLSRKFLFSVGGGEPTLAEASETALDDVVDAVLHSRPLAFRYEAVSRPAERRRVQPLSLAIYQHQLYLIGRDKTDSRPHPFRFARMRNVTVAAGSFPYPTVQEYNPDALLAKSIGMYLSDDYPVEHVRVRLSGRWATYAATHRWHRSQEVAPPDARGQVIVTWTVRACPELRALILSFGQSAEVLAPVTLRNAIAKELRATASVYARAGRPGLAVAPAERGSRTAVPRRRQSAAARP